MAPAVVKISLSWSSDAPPRYADVPTPSRIVESVTKELLYVLARGPLHGGSCVHVGDAKIICASLNGRGSSSCKGTFEKSHMLLLVLSNEEHVIEEMFIKASRFKVGL
jgi:hypothetical protein